MNKTFDPIKFFSLGCKIDFSHDFLSRIVWGSKSETKQGLEKCSLIDLKNDNGINTSIRDFLEILGGKRNFPKRRISLSQLASFLSSVKVNMSEYGGKQIACYVKAKRRNFIVLIEVDKNQKIAIDCYGSEPKSDHEIHSLDFLLVSN